jgi:hypothetical protein
MQSRGRACRASHSYPLQQQQHLASAQYKMTSMRQRAAAAAPLLLLMLVWCCSCSPARAELQVEGPAAAAPPAADALLCPVSAQQMSTAAPETATQAVRDACESGARVTALHASSFSLPRQ